MSGEGLLPNDPGRDEALATYFTYGEGGRGIIGAGAPRLVFDSPMPPYRFQDPQPGSGGLAQQPRR